MQVNKKYKTYQFSCLWTSADMYIIRLDYSGTSYHSLTNWTSIDNHVGKIVCFINIVWITDVRKANVWHFDMKINAYYFVAFKETKSTLNYFRMQTIWIFFFSIAIIKIFVFRFPFIFYFNLCKNLKIVIFWVVQLDGFLDWGQKIDPLMHNSCKFKFLTFKILTSQIWILRFTF